MQIFICYDALATGTKNNPFNDKNGLEALTKIVEHQKAILVPSCGLDEDGERPDFQGVNIYARDSEKFRTFERWLVGIYGSFSKEVIPVNFNVKSRDWKKTIDLSSDLLNRGVEVRGYLLDDRIYEGPQDRLRSPEKKFFPFEEMRQETRQFWDLECSVRSSLDFEEVFGAGLTLVKEGCVDYPNIKWAINRGPIPPSEELKKNIHQIYFGENSFV